MATRSNATHQSVTDLEVRLARKSAGQTTVLAHVGRVVIDNRHGLVVATDVRSPEYNAERDAAHAGYAVSQVKRKLVEEGFGWGKTIGGLRKLHH